MMNRETIREATADDAGLIAALIRDSFRDVAVRFSLTPENCPKHPSNCTHSWVEGDQSRGVRYFIVSTQDEPVGCVGLEKRDESMSFLERLAVLPQHRQRGFGRSLVDHVISHLEGSGSLRLSAAIIADHVELKYWYQRIGFAETGTKTFPHLPFAVTFLELHLDESANHRVKDIVAIAPNPHP